MRARMKHLVLFSTCILTLCQIVVVEGECGENKFQCDGTLCIPNTWKCDGNADCDDETDEQSCDDSVSKRSTDPVVGPHIELLKCPPNYMRCPKEEICIPIANFCDNKRDCPIYHGDEENCTAASHTLNCDTKSCEYKCRLTAQGPMCFCPKGKQPKDLSCVDVNRCDYPDLFHCEKNCKPANKKLANGRLESGGLAMGRLASLNCDCPPGYSLDVTKQHCTADNVPFSQKNTIIIADFNRVRRIKIGDGSDVAPPVNIAGHGIRTIDFDHRNNSACWLSYELTKRRTTMQCVDLTDLSRGWTMNTTVSLDIIAQIARDWVTGNWYFVDQVMKRIILCNSDAQNCRIVVEYEFSFIKALRLDPIKGVMFFLIEDAKQIAKPTSIDGHTAIVRASLDGSNQKIIVQEKLNKPYDIALDYANDHLYWIDPELQSVMRVDYDGKSLRKILSHLRPMINEKHLHGYGLEVFEDYLYIATQNPSLVVRAHRTNYSDHVRVITYDVDQPFQLHIYNRQRQPDLPEKKKNPCEKDVCEHLCIPDWSTGEARCYCAAGYVMDNITQKCIEKTDCEQPECIDESCPSDKACNVSTPCRSDYNRCPLAECIPVTWWCDGENDCSDKTDEQFCGYRTCTVAEFRCKNGQCIDSAFLCDGAEDCNDKTDEMFCTNKCDSLYEFTCGGNGICIPDLLRCNGMQDCVDGSDEANCTEHTEKPTSEMCHHSVEFTCANGRCIPSIWTCDGDGDCEDDSDERNCANTTQHTPRCHNDTNSFLCNNRCIPMAWKCDGDYDCTDKSDEEDCELKSCKHPEFVYCKNKECIAKEKVCDGNKDCSDNSDEEDCGKCSTWGICSQTCSKPDNSPKKCGCLEGYKLEEDQYTCKPTGEEPVYIIFSNQHQMRRVEFKNESYIYASLVSGLKNTIALDFHYQKNWIFWTDVIDDKIFRGTMLGNSTFAPINDIDMERTSSSPVGDCLTNIEPIIDIGLATTEGLAIDWIGNNIYWVESNLDQIEVAKLNGSFRTTLIAGNMISPRAIVLDPRVGSLFWTDWDSENPRIETCSMDGTGRKVIFNITKLIGSGWPNGLTIDYDFYRLYWIDARSDSIHTTKYDGTDHRLILKGHDKMRHPFALTLFGIYIYWTDWSSSALLRANKFNGSDVTVIQKMLSQPFDLQVYHPHRQPHAFNPCGEKNGGCSHLCLLGFNGTSSCRCPHLYKLGADNKTCDKDNTFLLFVKRQEIRGVDLQNAHYNVIPTITIPNVDIPTAIDYDLDTERLYWADKALNCISSAHINGSSVETIIDSGIISPEALAIDWLSKNMYFSSYDSSQQKATISVAKLDGAFRAEITPDNVIAPNSLAVSPSEGLLFWSDKTAVGTPEFHICSSRLDGKNVKTLISDEKVSHPGSLQVDTINKKLFWANTKSGYIWYCDFDGQNPNKIDKSLPSLLAITVYNGNTLYMSHGQSIAYMDTKGGNYGVLRDKTTGVQALRVFDSNSRQGASNGCVDNNGGCDHLCLPISATDVVCKCTAGYRLVNEKKCEGIQSFLMYSSGSDIHGISFNKSETMTALPHISKVSKASDIDFRAASDTIYWVDGSSYTISHIRRDLTERDNMIKDQVRGIIGLAVDWISGNVYWANFGQDIIEVVRMDGSEQRYVVVHGDIDTPKSLVVHPVQGLLFWSDTGTGKIEQACLDGSRRKTVVTEVSEQEIQLAIDYDTNLLYWCNKDSGKIKSYNIINSNIDTVLDNGAEDCTSITIFNQYLYWLKGGNDGSILRLEKTGGTNHEIVVMRDKLGPNLKSIKAFDASRQSGTNPCQVNNGGCEGFCFYLGDNTIKCACSYGVLSEDQKSCKPHKEFLIYSKVTTIASLALDQENRNHPVKPIQDKEHLRNVIGLVTHFDKQRIYFSDIQRGDIQFVTFNGTEFTVVVDSVGSAEGLAFDDDSHYLYWTSYTNSSISRALINPDTGKMVGNASSIEKLVQLGVTDHPRAIAIDSCSSVMFWTNWHDEAPRIQKSFLNGYQKESIITDQVWTPNGLTIDHKEQRLYWSDARLDKIERCDFDGGHRTVVVAGVPEHSFGIAVYGNYLYWTDWIRRAVIRSNKYDGNDVYFMQRNLERQPMGIVVVAKDAHDCTVNLCHENQFGCEDLCYHDTEGKPQCGCTKGILLSDGKRCGPANATCSMEDFVCHDQSACIPGAKTCNNILDCVDGSDEFSEVCDGRECPIDQFTCRNFRCIALHKFCDRKNDCGDGSDETHCTCNDDEFQCQSGLCLKKQYRCDRDKDCPDFDDEIGCDVTCDHLEMFENEKGPIVKCNITSQCIMQSWICDGNNDCWDGSDEANCGNKTTVCADGGFQCASDKNCIPLQWVCDTDNDCPDNSDESNCNYTCEANMFQCNDTKVCLPRSWECDDHADCANESDEGDHCNHVNRTCKEGEFKCNGTGRCIPEQWKCDGDIDCQQGEDERTESGCPPAKCNSDEFECKNRRCIRNMFLCDRDDDCGDGSDEPDTCVYESCAADLEFQCKRNGTCIPIHLKCNKFYDCPDHSDEEGCDTAPTETCGKEGLFQCDNEVCINDTFVCDGKNDCGDFTDEPEHCNINECNNDVWKVICSQHCRDKKIGFECYCDSGYTLNKNNITCDNIDECSTQSPCSHYCIDLPGSYRCTCAEGYQLEPDRHGCKYNITEEPFLIVANRYYIRNVSFSGNQQILTSGINNAVALGYHHKMSLMYWTDITSKNSTINRMKFGNESSKEVIHSSTVRNPDGLAIDWVADNLYWCDKTTDTIEVSKLNGYFRKVLIKDGLEEPRALEVFPAKGYMFYTDWGENAHISRAFMDGSVTERIITEDISWPNALTIDYITEKIFWADASLDYIAVADLDGRNRKIVLDQNLPHTFALTTFQDDIFWTDWEIGSVERANKFSGENRRPVCKSIQRLMDIQVYHTLRQMPVPNNPCHPNNGGCSHLCLLLPEKNGVYESLRRQCACPENHILLKNGTCEPNCTSSQFLCSRSSKCIPFWWRCDGQNDCEDGSDEPPGCPPYKCETHGLFRCNNRSDHCIPPPEICDGTAQCEDSSDELKCDTYTCLDEYTKCYDQDQKQKCIPNSKLCNGEVDCYNGTDEQNCTVKDCQENQFKCGNGRCVPYVWRCDGDNDCGDHSDEPDDCRKANCKGGYFQCKSGRCIPDSWKCDGDVDCGINDNTDEDYNHCYNRTCDESYFRCENKHCIPGRWRCDYDNDCRDGSDEKNCAYRNCTDEEYTCNNKKCIPLSWKCNGEVNCEDGSDEATCEATKSCSNEEFPCSNICIPKKWHCDGDIDCPNGADEKSCESKTCTDGKFKCKNSKCIPKLWKCDGDDDCDDNSDEDTTMCKDHLCPLGRFRCRNHKCVFNNKRCDGVDDCGDGSDELNCYYDYVCKPRDFKCQNSHRCIPMHQVCDNVTHCIDKSDENQKTTCANIVNSCTGLNNCQHFCINMTKVGYKCACKTGYSLAEDGFTCKDVDLCKKWGTCSQLCQSFTKGKYNCSCENGYEMAFNPSTGLPSCVAKGNVKPQMLVANENIMIRSDVGRGGEEGTALTVEDKMLSLDIDMTTTNKKWIGFFVSHDSSIKTFQIDAPSDNSKPTKNNSRKKRETVTVKNVVKDVAVPRGVTVDWIGKNLYWTDSRTQTIEMIDYTGERRITVVDERLDQPYSIAVDPEAGKLYWTDRGFPPKIESSNLDGSGRKDLVKDDIIWPNGLAIDYANRRLYWTDTKKHTIETVTLSGENRQIVHQFDASDPPFMIDVFEDNLYVSLYRSHSIVKLNKFSSSDNSNPVQYLMRNMTSIFDIIVMHPAKQKKSIPNYCTSNSTYNPCDAAFCVNMPQAKQQKDKFKCMCSKDADFVDGKCDFKKQCPAGYCHNNGTCHSRSNGVPKCSCLVGTSGDQCEKCDNYCYNNGVCKTNPTGPPSCQCVNGYYGKRCEQYKCTGFCKNGGHCFIRSGNPLCRCQAKYTGTKCETELDDICSQFCENGGRCSFGFLPGRIQGINLPQRRMCSCPQGFKGERCEQCDNFLCLNGGVCRHDKDKKPYCECPQDIPNRDQCLDTLCEGYCMNSGTCTYSQEVGGPVCKCRSGFNGTRCQVNLNRCASYCLNGATCMALNSIETPFLCICKLGYSGKTCSEHTDKCAGNPCGPGTCELDVNRNRVCTCPAVYEGSVCQTCRCKNGGECRKSSSDYTCVCKDPTSWRGRLCDESTCEGYCFNGGVCQNCSYNSLLSEGICESCKCPPGYTGQRCKHEAEEASYQKSNLLPIIIAPLIAILLIVLIIVLILVIRRKRDQFKHRRMHNNSNIEHANPIYLAQPPGHDDEDERELAPLEDYEIDQSTNFANPMYNRLYASDSTQVLLPKETDTNSPYDENGDIHFTSKKGEKKTANGKGPYP